MDNVAVLRLDILTNLKKIKVRGNACKNTLIQVQIFFL